MRGSHHVPGGDKGRDKSMSNKYTSAGGQDLGLVADTRHVEKESRWSLIHHTEGSSIGSWVR